MLHIAAVAYHTLIARISLCVCRLVKRLEARCEEREGQLQVLTDTVETLTAGTPDELVQRLVMLTASASAAAAREAAASQRANDLLVRCMSGVASGVGQRVVVIVLAAPLDHMTVLITTRLHQCLAGLSPCHQ